MHDGMPYGQNQGQGHSREVDRQSPTGLIFIPVYSTVLGHPKRMHSLGVNGDGKSWVCWEKWPLKRL